jgi:Mor family transcriptional regulator
MSENWQEEWRKLPPGMFPRIEELPGDLSLIAATIEKYAPGQGVAITLALAAIFRGTTSYWHNMDALGRKVRDRWMREQFDQGVRVPQIARTVGLSERQAWEIMGKLPINDKQGRLF